VKAAPCAFATGGLDRSATLLSEIAGLTSPCARFAVSS